MYHFNISCQCRNYFKYDKLKELGDMCKQMANDSKSDKLYTIKLLFKCFSQIITNDGTNEGITFS